MMNRMLLLKWIYDYLFTTLKYIKIFRRIPNLFKPVTFNEHIYRKKLLDRSNLLRIFADKFEARKFIENKIGIQYLTKLYLVTNNVITTDAETLPDSFVLKATHGSGMNYFVRNKHVANLEEMVNQTVQWRSVNYYKIGREWCYDGLPVRFIYEELLSDECGKFPRDYKVFCFHGQPKVIQVDIDRFVDQKRALYSVEWEKLGIGYHYPFYDGIIEKPLNYEKMLEIAAALSADVDFVRVDLYNLNGRIFVGELTNYPGNGFEKFTDLAMDRLMGSYWRK